MILPSYSDIFFANDHLSSFKFLQMNVPLYGLLGVAAALLIYIIGIGMILKLFICLLALILGYDSFAFKILMLKTLIFLSI